MKSDDDALSRWGFAKVPSGISPFAIERDSGLEDRAMQNNEQRTIAQAAADLTTEAMAQFALVGRDPGMTIATQIMRGLINGHGLVDRNQRFVVAYHLEKITHELVVQELSKLVMPPRQSPLTWQQAAALVDARRATLYDQYRKHLIDPRDMKA